MIYGYWYELLDAIVSSSTSNPQCSGRSKYWHCGGGEMGKETEKGMICLGCTSYHNRLPCLPACLPASLPPCLLNCSWPSSAQRFLVPSLMTIFYCLTALGAFRSLTLNRLPRGALFEGNCSPVYWSSSIIKYCH
jgi:hypothetical protein